MKDFIVESIVVILFVVIVVFLLESCSENYAKVYKIPYIETLRETYIQSGCSHTLLPEVVDANLHLKKAKDDNVHQANLYKDIDFIDVKACEK